MEKIANLALFDKVNGKDLVLNQGEMGKGEKCITQRDHYAMVTNNVTNRLDGSHIISPKREAPLKHKKDLI